METKQAPENVSNSSKPDPEGNAWTRQPDKYNTIRVEYRWFHDDGGFAYMEETPSGYDEEVRLIYSRDRLLKHEVATGEEARRIGDRLNAGEEVDMEELLS